MSIDRIESSLSTVNLRRLRKEQRKAYRDKIKAERQKYIDFVKNHQASEVNRQSIEQDLGIHTAKSQRELNEYKQQFEQALKERDGQQYLNYVKKHQAPEVNRQSIEQDLGIHTAKSQRELNEYKQQFEHTLVS